jgi:hypothetical protein
MAAGRRGTSPVMRQALEGIPVHWQGHCPVHQGRYRHHPSMPLR